MADSSEYPIVTHWKVGSLLLALLLFGIALASPRAAFADESIDCQINPLVVSYQDETLREAVDRSWFGQSISFSSSLTLQSRHFDGNNVGIEMNASCPLNGTFSVYLKRSGTNQYIGAAATFKRNGFTKATWSGVGPGDYTFYLRKSSDGSVVRSNDVAMYSW